MWLEDYLSKWNKMLFMVCHSQDFLNNVRDARAASSSASLGSGMKLSPPPPLAALTRALSQVCTHIVHLDQHHRRLVYYRGNYDSFVDTRNDAMTEQLKRCERPRAEGRRRDEGESGTKLRPPSLPAGTRPSRRTSSR